ncbi:MAG TPA: Asp-tRNA(Asn)/Glu-tRNA(Gln) amidotransferase subunit GatB [Candidatus Methylomirabilis sp.]|nr:Asp-tRNA(Asn)/Glu-tRNA(Gln) amidotransferase subunit GatB [Candidatus Methylomirabilis sp.]
MAFEAVIGLEVHAQLLTRSKIFCGCSTTFGEAPNTQTCPVCLGMPGILPVLNRQAVAFALKLALATGCTIARSSRFARKNYFYPDLPKNYQISQYELPLAEHGSIEIGDGAGRKRVGIRRIHLEEDAGKLLHAGSLDAAPFSLVDFNRCGVPLIEIVSEPDFRSAEEAVEYLKKLRAILVYLEICDGNMEEGSLRCDANVSVRPAGTTALGVKTEVKNMNSFRSVQRALEYEIQRLTKRLGAGERIVQETRLWAADQGVTLSMRSKEEAHDYRYFPEPDLVPVVVEEAWLVELRAGLPELPDVRKARFVSQYGLPAYDAGVLTASRPLAGFYEEVVRLHPDPKAASNWVMVELLGLLNRDGLEITQTPVGAQDVADLLEAVKAGKISGSAAKTVFEKVYEENRGKLARVEPTGAGRVTVADVIKREGLEQVSDADELARIVDEVLAANAGVVAEFRAGKEKSFTFLVGQAMRATRGKGNPKLINELLRARLARDGGK